MSATLDALSPEDKRLYDQMRADDASADAELGPVEPAPAPPPAEPAPEAEPAAEPANTTVPQAALHQERERRKAAERRERELEQKHAAEMARAQERLNLLVQAAEGITHQPPPPAQALPPAPDPAVDPLGYVQHELADARRQIAEIRQGAAQSADFQRQQTDLQRAHAQVQELTAWGHAQEMEFAESTPDYAQAMQHLRSVRERYHAARGANPAQIGPLVHADLVKEAYDARQSGRHFGRTLYELAGALGYTPGTQAAQPQATAAAPQQANGGQTPEQRIAAAQRGAQMAGGVGSAGAAPRGELTPQRLASMSEDEFAAVYAKMSKAAKRQMLGD